MSKSLSVDLRVRVLSAVSAGAALVPTLKPGNVVILDNLSSHKRPAAREMIEGCAHAEVRRGHRLPPR